MGDLADAAVLVTGAGSGIGAAIAAAAARAGARVAVNDVDGGRADATCDQIAAHGATVHAVAGDVADEAGAARVVADAAERLGGLTGVVNNVGLVRGGPLAGLTLDDWDLTLRVDLTSTFLVSRAARPVLAQAAGTAAVVNLASLVATAPAPGSGAYSAAKAAVVALTQQMALEWGPQGIRVNAISAGPMRTLAMAGISGGKTLMKTGKDWSMLKEDTRMEGVAGAALYLLSDLGHSCTGEVLHVDAGFHAVGVPDIADEG